MRRPVYLSNGDELYLPHIRVGGNDRRPLCLPEQALPVAEAAGKLWHAFADDTARSMQDDYRDCVIVGVRSAFQHPAAGFRRVTLLLGGVWWRVEGGHIVRASAPRIVGADYVDEPAKKARWQHTYEAGDFVVGGAETFLAHRAAHGVHASTVIHKVLAFLAVTDIGCFVDMTPLYDAGLTPAFEVRGCSLTTEDCE